MTRRPTTYMGYHVMPNAPLALILASVFGGKAIYQMTGGPIQVLDGGYRSENPLLAALGGPSWILEKMMFAMLRCFDLIVVRGQSAQTFVRDEQLNSCSAVITGAIDTERFKPLPLAEKDCDVVYVSRLVPNKGVEHCVEVTAELKRLGVQCRVVMVGGGPLEDSLRARANELGIEENLIFTGQQEDVVPLLQRTRVFMLLSPSEGMSIAMLEGLATGLPVIVTRVGDLADTFSWGPVGHLVDEVKPAEIAETLKMIFEDETLWTRYAQQARETIESHYSMQAISERWRDIFVADGTST